jgi:hypothetical protein
MDSPEIERQLRGNEEKRKLKKSTVVSVFQDHSNTTSGFAEDIDDTGINELQSVLYNQSASVSLCAAEPTNSQDNV